MNWETVKFTDSFVQCPLSAMSAEVQKEVDQRADSKYLLAFSEMMYKKRDSQNATPLLPNFIKQQPLHRFCILVTLFNENEMTLQEALAHDLKLAQEELNNTTTDIKEARESVELIAFCQNILLKGQKTSNISDVIDVMPDELLSGSNLIPDKQVHYYNLDYQGYRL